MAIKSINRNVQKPIQRPCTTPATRKQVVLGSGPLKRMVYEDDAKAELLRLAGIGITLKVGE